jgi:hypothetical protein
MYHDDMFSRRDRPREGAREALRPRGDDPPSRPRRWRVSVSVNRATSPGLFTTIVVLLAVGLLAAATLLIVVGTVLLWVAGLALVVAILFVAGRLRRLFLRRRR